ncbi:hypothetical protein [Acetobacter okinawensis]|uniref:DUF6874 domain-containing protein n=1 Tax=Acetobacter okinawensis TaxID=1076594 RepID=A0A252BXZ2_9PROT|nr:hypothetical protein [Acetobacter okinawensis]OUJ13838.1 hypothetical protein HK26_04150 [Acetobacter okinawensis]
MSVKFTATPKEMEIIIRISRRVAELYVARGEEIIPMDVMLDIQMDLCAVHSSGCPMDFSRLENADDFNLMHDVAGIARHLDRRTGKLTDMFRPRFAKKEVA